jgi:hypothetical protein
MPEESGVQAATAGLINACTDLTTAQSVLDLQLETAICFLQTQVQNGPTRIVINGGIDYVIEQLQFVDNIFIWECFAKSFTFPTLVDCQQGLYFSTNTTDGNMSFLQTIDIPNLLAINATLFIERIPNLTTVNAGSLQHVGGNIDIGSNTRLTTVDFHSVEFIGGDFLASGSLLAGLQMPLLTHFGGTQFLCDSNGIPTADVNALLITLNGLGLTGVAINFAGGGNGPATGAGLAAAAQLVIDGNTVTLNP